MHVDSRRIDEVIYKKKLENSRIVTKNNFEEILLALHATGKDRAEIS
jgi:hypothetical protein